MSAALTPAELAAMPVCPRCMRPDLPEGAAPSGRFCGKRDSGNCALVGKARTVERIATVRFLNARASALLSQDLQDVADAIVRGEHRR